MRVVNPLHIPKTAPHATSLELMRDVASYLEGFGLDAADAVGDHIEAACTELEAGRLEGFLACMVDLEVSLAELGRVIQLVKGSRTVLLATNPEIADELAPLLRECGERTLSMQFAGVPVRALEAYRAQHAAFCKMPRCIQLAAIDAAILKARGGS